jgi:serine/threonine protein kinase
VRQIGRYQILEELGRGAMGIVYKARDPAIGRTIAIKTIHLEDLTDEVERARLRERLFREAQSAGMLSHPGIVTIYDIAEENGMAYIFMEFVNGPPLEKMLKHEQTPDKETLLSIFRQTGSALDYEHKKGIVHRDIKPANIMIHEDGTAKVTDFGVAKIVSQQMTVAGTMMGTPSYMSPEQIQGGAITGGADQFALAVIAYEVLSGEKPFTADYMPTLLFKIVREEALSVDRLNPTLGPQVDEVLRRAMMKNSKDRYETCTMFVNALAAACNETPGWTPMPRGATHNLPTVGSGDRPNSDDAVNSMAETIADVGNFEEPPLKPAPMVVPALAFPDEPAPRPLIISEIPARVAPEHMVPAQPVHALAVAPDPIQVDPAGHDPIAPDPIRPSQIKIDALRPPRRPEPSHVVRNVILSAGLVALVLAIAAVVVLRYIRNPEPAPQTQEAVTQPDAATPPPPAAASKGPPPEVEAPAPPPPNTQPRESAEPAKTESAKAEPSKTVAGKGAPSPETRKATSPRDPKPAPAPEEATFQLTTSPAGAQVMFDGDRPCTSPCKLSLAMGRHTFVARLAGHRDVYQIIEIPRDTGLIVDLPRATGTLSLISDPPGLSVSVDGQDQPKKTPVHLTLGVGQHKIQVSRGSQKQEFTVEIHDGSLVTRTVELVNQ